MDGAAGKAGVSFERVGGVVAEGAVGVDEVRRAHAGDGARSGLFDREVRRQL